MTALVVCDTGIKIASQVMVLSPRLEYFYFPPRRIHDVALFSKSALSRGRMLSS
jgi:hypothetical protein